MVDLFFVTNIIMNKVKKNSKIFYFFSTQEGLNVLKIPKGTKSVKRYLNPKKNRTTYVKSEKKYQNLNVNP